MTTHTTKSGKAKCLHYRNGRRCGRVGKIMVSFRDRQGHHEYPVCRECADEIVNEKSGQVRGKSPKGYSVSTSNVWGWGVRREYTAL